MCRILQSDGKQNVGDKIPFCQLVCLCLLFFKLERKHALSRYQKTLTITMWPKYHDKLYQNTLQKKKSVKGH